MLFVTLAKRSRIGSVIRCNHPDVTRLRQRNACIARAGGIEIRPRLLAAFGTQRTDVGAIALRAYDRRAGADPQ